MTVFVLGFGVFVFALCGLAVGTLTGRGPLKGSCGGDTVLNACPLCKAKDNQ